HIVDHLFIIGRCFLIGTVYRRGDDDDLYTVDIGQASDGIQHFPAAHCRHVDVEEKKEGGAAAAMLVDIGKCFLAAGEAPWVRCHTDAAQYDIGHQIKDFIVVNDQNT